MNKKGASGNLAIFALLAIVALIGANTIWPGSVANLFSSQSANTGGITPAGTGTQTQVCANPTSAVTLGPQAAKWSPSTSMSSINIYLWDAGVKQGSKADSTAYSAAVGKTLKLMYGYGSSTYAATLKDVVVGCGAQSSASLSDGASELVARDTTPTISVFPADSGDKDTSGSANYTVGAGGQAIWTVKFEGTNEKGLAPIMSGRENSGIVVLAEFNTSAFDKGQMTLTGKNGLVVSGASVPDQRIWATNSTEHGAVAWKIPGYPNVLQGQKRGSFELVLTAKASDTQDPKGFDNSGVIELQFFPENYGLDPNTYEPVFGVEDSEGTYIGQVGYNVQLHSA